MKIVQRGETMRTELNPRRIRVQVERAAAQKDIDPEELWLDQDIAPEELIRLDPLDIDYDMVEQAEQPERADLLFLGISGRELSLKQEERELAQMKREFQASHGQSEETALVNWFNRVRKAGPS